MAPLEEGLPEDVPVEEQLEASSEVVFPLAGDDFMSQTGPDSLAPVPISDIDRLPVGERL